MLRHSCMGCKIAALRGLLLNPWGGPFKGSWIQVFFFAKLPKHLTFALFCGAIKEQK